MVQYGVNHDLDLCRKNAKGPFPIICSTSHFAWGAFSDRYIQGRAFSIRYLHFTLALIFGLYLSLILHLRIPIPVNPSVRHSEAATMRLWQTKSVMCKKGTGIFVTVFTDNLFTLTKLRLATPSSSKLELGFFASCFLEIFFLHNRTLEAKKAGRSEKG